MKLTLNNVNNLIDAATAKTTINNNSDATEVAVENTLSRDGTAPNQMESSFDMNSNQILNLPLPATDNSPLRLQDLADFIGAGTITNIPAGGITGQALKKNSNTNYDIGWANDVSSVGLALPSDFTISGSPVVSTGTLTGAWAIAPTGTGAVVRTASPNITSPVLTTPALGVATATSINKVAITAPATSATLTIPDGVVLTGPAASGTAMTLGNNETVLGVKTYGAAGNVGKLAVAGTTSGTTVVNATAVASGTLTLPAATDTLVGKATTDILTNKTFNTAGAGNVFQINGVGITANTGTGSNVLATSPTLVTPVLGAATATTINGAALDNLAWTAYTPSSAFSTPGTSVMGAAAGRWKQIGKVVVFSADCTVTTVGTASGNWIVGLPTAAQSASTPVGATGKEVITTGALLAIQGVSATTVACNKFDNTSIALMGNGSRIIFVGTYESA